MVAAFYSFAIAFLLMTCQLCITGKLYPKAVLYSILVFACTCFTTNHAAAQDARLTYQVKRGDKAIGTFTVQETTLATSKTIKLETHIKTSFIMSVSVEAKEESIFQNGILNYSSVFRKVNNDEKVNKRHRFYGNGYIIEAGKKKDSLCCVKITYNLMTLYNNEPAVITKVYSDNHQKFLPIKKTDTHVYRVDIPDGSYNKYFYHNGRCTKVEIHQSLYTVVMVLTDYS